MIKAIIFDLGGVLFDIDYDRSFERLSELMGEDLRVGNWPDAFKQIVFDYETGKLRSEEFLLKLQRSASGNVPQGNDLVEAWNSMLIGWQEGVFEMLDSLQLDYELYILSNINSLHVQQLVLSLKHRKGLTFLNQFFRKIYFSHEIGMRKPDAQAFQMILSDNNLLPEETLFIDDYPNNISEAKKLGIRCVVHDPNSAIKNDIERYLKNCLLQQ